jgi:hypothetical protein
MRHGKRTLRFNCIDMVIDAEAATVTLEVRELDGRRAEIPRNDLVRDLAPGGQSPVARRGPGTTWRSTSRGWC